MSGRLRIAFNVALLGAVVPSLRAVAVDWSERLIDCTFIYDQQVDEEMFDQASTVAAEIDADFWQTHKVEFLAQVSEPASRIDLERYMLIVFLRREIFESELRGL